MIEVPCQTLWIPFSSFPGVNFSLQLGIYHFHVCFYFYMWNPYTIWHKHINGIKHIFYNFLFITDNFLHFIATGIKWNCWVCSASLSPKRNLSVTELNLSLDAPAYVAVCFLLHGNETGNWNPHPSSQRQEYSPKLTSSKFSSIIWNPLVYRVFLRLLQKCGN